VTTTFQNIIYDLTLVTSLVQIQTAKHIWTLFTASSSVVCMFLIVCLFPFCVRGALQQVTIPLFGELIWHRNIYVLLQKPWHMLFQKILYKWGHRQMSLCVGLRCPDWLWDLLSPLPIPWFGGPFPRSEANHWPTFGAKLKKAWNYASILPYVFMM
jgi:hypothetical protein